PDRFHEAQSLHLRYGPSVALPTLNPCRCLHEPKARFPVERLFSLPGRELHPLEAPGFSWRTEETLDVDLQHPAAPHHRQTLPEIRKGQVRGPSGSKAV